MILILKYCHYEEEHLDMFFIASSRRMMDGQTAAKYKIEHSKVKVVWNHTVQLFYVISEFQLVMFRQRLSN